MTSSVFGGGGLQAQLTKALGQRDEARAQRDKTRDQRDKLRTEVAELRLRVAELNEQREVQIDARHERADEAGVPHTVFGPERSASLLKRELAAESARVQSLERNLDHVLRRSAELESRLSRTRAMLAVAIDDGEIDLASVRQEIAANRAESAAALSHAMLALLDALPPAEVRAALPRPPAPVRPTVAAAPLAIDPPLGETPDVVDEVRPAPGAPPAPASEAPGVAPSAEVIARLPEPAVLKGKLLTPGRHKKVAEERQLQIDAFLADGEYARIAALKDVHKGRRAFILGNGPSLAQQDLSRLEGEVTFVANWFANHDGFDALKPRYYAISSHEMFGGWARQNPVLNASFVEKLTRHAHKPEMFFSHRFRRALLDDPALQGYERRFLMFDRPKFLADEVGGLEFDLSQPMHDGYTVLLTFCVPLAVHMGITEIYMVGCDCDYGIQANTDARSYFYAPTEHATSSTKAENITRIWAENGPLFRVYELARDACAARGVTMFNATAGGKLEVLPRVDYDTVLSRPAAEAAPATDD